MTSHPLLSVPAELLPHWISRVEFLVEIDLHWRELPSEGRAEVCSEGRARCGEQIDITDS
jgi:hypothetical protein